MKLVLATAPTSEPIDLTTAKNYCHVDNTADDALITSLIISARQYVEKQLRMALLTQSWKLYLDNWVERRRTARYGLQAWLQLPLPPLQSITSITYRQPTNTWVTWSPSLYVVTTGIPGKLAPVWGQIFPVTQDQIESVEIDFTAGYTSAALIPEPIKQAMLVCVNTWYQERSNIGVANLKEIPFCVDALLSVGNWGSYT
jgi:uncharacterized phiE125 gp8 family phage protein